MRKKLVAVLLACISVFNLVYLSACQDISLDFSLKFMVDGELYATVKTLGNEIIKMPDDPQKEGYIFDGWYWDDGEWQRPFTVNSLLNEKLTSDMAVYAKWKTESEDNGDPNNSGGNTGDNNDPNNPGGNTGDNNDPNNPGGNTGDNNDPNSPGGNTGDNNDPNNPGENPGEDDPNNPDNDIKPFVLGIDGVGNIFNPFFGTDRSEEITSKTQVKMLTNDANGTPYCGEDEPTVALNYSQVITYDNKEYRDGVTPDLGNRMPSSISADEYYTTYQFLIKNNIKFSDGQPLTIKDVIFSLYTYLDPVYTGSSTICSTPIKGLLAYRTQDPNANAEINEQFNQTVTINANNRLVNVRMAYTKDDKNREIYRSTIYSSEAMRMTVLNDVEAIRYMFWEEINSEYNNAAVALNKYIQENERLANEKDPTSKAGLDAMYLGFTEVWEVFLYNMGYIDVQYNLDGTIKRFESDAQASGKFDKNGRELKKGDKWIDYQGCWQWWHDRDSMIKIVFNFNMGIGDSGTILADYNHAKEDVDGNKAPESAEYGPKCDILVDDFGKAIGSVLKKSDNDAEYWDLLWNDYRLLYNLYDIVTYWDTANTALDQFIAEEKSKYFATWYMSVDTIEGITVRKLVAGDTFEGNMGTTVIAEEMYVLKIVIDRVDPTAIWNFNFNVAPMHYYSNANNDTSNSGYTAEDDYRAFNYPVYDRNGNLFSEDGNIWNGSWPISVGRPFADIDYFNKVIKSGKVAVPVGAGMYKVASQDMTDEDYASDIRPTITEFYSDNTIYFIRNPYFYTTSGLGYSSNEEALNNGADITNCKIKYVQYKILDGFKQLNAILSGEIHYATPSATAYYINQLNADPDVDFMIAENNGYGYIGINPKYVPDIEIRQAIMHAMNINLCCAYYGEFASAIYRPVSGVSWASPQNPSNPGVLADGKSIYEAFKNEGVRYKFDENGDVIKGLVQKAGYNTSVTPATRMLPNGTLHKLEYTFIIPGNSDDHPAYMTMWRAAEILNMCGFKITVMIDPNAKSKIENGTLAVWADEKVSGIDPDLYSEYHKDSTATSVRNWGTKILNDPTELYKDERDIIDRLSRLIDEGRSTFDNAKRASVYYEAYEKVMQLAVELPTYQRVDLFAFRSDVADITTLNNRITAFRGPLASMWKVGFKQ